LEAQIREIIIDAMRMQSDTLDRPLTQLLSPDTALIGENSELDSMSLVLLIVDVEQQIELRLGQKISLVNERAMSARSSPFRSISSMANYAMKLLRVPAP
jgi:acyl carrier protein